MFQLTLCDRQPELVEQWQTHFTAHPEVEILRGDLMDVSADAYVSPANGQGWMDGGIDLDLRERFAAHDIETRVQRAIKAAGRYSLPVGQALIVATEDEKVPYLVVAPTMDTPMFVGMTSNAYAAMSAVLRAVAAFNQGAQPPIESVAVPGLCTGVGGMEARVAALQMHQAYANWSSENFRFCGFYRAVQLLSLCSVPHCIHAPTEVSGACAHFQTLFWNPFGRRRKPRQR